MHGNYATGFYFSAGTYSTEQMEMEFFFCSYSYIIFVELEIE